MSISKEQVENATLKLSASFDFKFGEELTSLLHTSICKEDFDKFIRICNELMLLTKKQWTDKFGFNSKPSIGDWLSFFNKTPLDFTDIALLECSKVIEIAKKFRLESQVAYLFENGVTNAVVIDLGGIKAISKAIETKDGYGVKDDLSFFRHDFQKMWLTFKKVNQSSNEASGNLTRVIKKGDTYGDGVEYADNPLVRISDSSLQNKKELRIEYFN